MRYEYACTDCGRIVEIVESVAEMEATRETKRCQFCEGRLAKLFSIPSLNTDTTFQKGIRRCDGFIDPRDRIRAHQLARKMGINIAGKRYDGELARFPGDPLACYGDQAEARAICRRMKRGCANLGVAEPEPEPPKPYAVAEDIIENHAREKVITEHGGSVPMKQYKKIKEELRHRLKGTMK